MVPRRARHIKREYRDRDALTRRTGRLFRRCERDQRGGEGGGPTPEREAPLPSGVPPRAFIPSCTVPVKPALFELSQWRNKTSTGGSNSTPKPKRSLLPFPSTAEAPPPFSLPPYLPCSPTHHATPRFWSSPVPPLALDSQTTKLPPSVAQPRGAHSALFSLSLLLASLSLSLGVHATPFPLPGRSTSSATVRGRSCRFLKCKYQSRNKRQRLAVQDESIVSA